MLLVVYCLVRPSPNWFPFFLFFFISWFFLNLIVSMLLVVYCLVRPSPNWFPFPGSTMSSHPHLNSWLFDWLIVCLKTCLFVDTHCTVLLIYCLARPSSNWFPFPGSPTSSQQPTYTLPPSPLLYFLTFLCCQGPYWNNRQVICLFYIKFPSQDLFHSAIYSHLGPKLYERATF